MSSFIFINLLVSLLEQGWKQNKFHIVDLVVDVVILNNKVQVAVVPADIWVSDGICN
jgi:hypothetical protein